MRAILYKKELFSEHTHSHSSQMKDIKYAGIRNQTHTGRLCRDFRSCSVKLYIMVKKIQFFKQQTHVVNTHPRSTHTHFRQYSIILLGTKTNHKLGSLKLDLFLDKNQRFLHNPVQLHLIIQL